MVETAWLGLSLGERRKPSVLRGTWISFNVCDPQRAGRGRAGPPLSKFTTAFGSIWVCPVPPPLSPHPVSTPAAITKYHTLGGSNSTRLFLTVWMLENPRPRCWLIQLLVKALFLACDCCLPTRWGGKAALWSVFINNPTMEAPPARPHLNLITSQKPHFQMPSYWGLRLQHKN